MAEQRNVDLNNPLPTLQSLGLDPGLIDEGDALLVLEFLAGDTVRRRPQNRHMYATNDFRANAYTCLAQVLRVLKQHSILHIVDTDPNPFIQRIEALRCFGFQGGWLDRLERHIRENRGNTQLALNQWEAKMDSLQLDWEQADRRLKQLETIRTQYGTQLDEPKRVVANIKAARASVILSQPYTFADA